MPVATDPELLRHYAAPRPPLWADGISSDERRVLDTICSRPEIALLVAGLELSVDGSLEVPFTSAQGRLVAFHPAALVDLESGTSVVRHAAELALWQRLSGDARTLAVDLATGLLACRVAGIDVAGRRARVQVHAGREAPWLAELRALVAADPFPMEETLAVLPRLANRLQQLQRAPRVVGSGEIHAVTDEVAALLTRCIEVAAPVELLLTTGGDSRLRVDPVRGLNHYGCSPRPRPWAVTFASCTATSISSPAYAHAESLRQRLMQCALRGDLEPEFNAQMGRIKREILALCGSDQDAEVILTTSGTDAELCALQIAMTAEGEHLVNVVVGPNETGSSVGVAAAGRHFDSQTALGVAVHKGERLDGLAEGQVQVEEIPIRELDGTLRPSKSVDRDVNDVVGRAVAGGRRVLLHVLDTSKTGLVAPDLDTISGIQRRHGNAVDIVVDASQLRIDRAVLEAYQRRKCIVLLTGSKFVTGPPFAGAVLVPGEVARRARQVSMLPGLSAYATRHEWPAAWRHAQGGLSPRRNLGLLLRWESALWELRAFRAVPADQAKGTLSRFGEAMVAAIACRPHLAPVPTRPIDRGDLGDDGWDRLPTIFPFTVARGDGSRMGLADLRTVYEWLNQDISPGLPEAADPRERKLAAKCCHIAQPIVVAGDGGNELAALRISGGARLVSGVAFDPDLGDMREERLQREIDDALRVFEKIDLILRHHSSLVLRLAPLTVDAATAVSCR